MPSTAAFIALGLPSVELMTEPGAYDTNHHAIMDTLEKIDRRALNADTAAIALLALGVANAEDARARRLIGPEVVELLERTGLLGEARLIRGKSWVPR